MGDILALEILNYQSQKNMRTNSLDALLKKFAV